MKCYLRYQADALADAEACRSIAEAKEKFTQAALQLDRYGQKIEATIHIAPALTEAAEYPDYLLSLSPNGRLICEEC